jgi:hypothetical protein
MQPNLPIKSRHGDAAVVLDDGTMKRSDPPITSSTRCVLPALGGNFSAACGNSNSGETAGLSSTSVAVPAAHLCQVAPKVSFDLEFDLMFFASAMLDHVVAGEAQPGPHHGVFYAPVKHLLSP